VSPARRAAAWLLTAEERQAVQAASKAADAALAGLATVIAVATVIMQARNAAGAVPTAVARIGFSVVRLDSPYSHWPSTGTLVGVALTTAPLAFRRIYPITVFGVILVALIGTTSYATTVTFASLIFAAYCAVAYSPFRRLALLGVLAAALMVTAAYPNTSPPVPERFTALLILLPTVAVGIVIRLWRGRARESAERLRRAEAEHEAKTRRAVEQERARIASEMHDVVTHNVSVMVVQAGAARRVLASSPEDAREALLAVEASGRTAMSELRYLLGLLAPEGGDAAGTAGANAAEVAEVAEVGTATASWAGVGGENLALAPQPGVARIPALLARVCAAGMPVELVVDPAGGTEPALPPGVDLAAFRVVQEALTNVMKHAGATRAVVRLAYRPGDLLITVTDEGPPPGPAPVAHVSGIAPAVGASRSGGRGLIGLRERIAVYGGELDAGPRAGGGWRLMARIPVAEAAAGPLAVAPEFLGAAS
jgi:signal transduction histidine kinase